MPRNLDLTAVRSFVAVADTGGVTKASAVLNLTQSAVSMQLKRLEESLDQQLLDRTGRGVGLTTAGEQLLSYGRKILALNDEVMNRMTDVAYEGTLVLGVPSDIVYPAIPPVLRFFHVEHPRMKVQLLSSYTLRLKEMFARGECDLILTTEDHCDPGGETLTEKPLLWYGAKDGVAWQRRPLPLASQPKCQFRKGMIASLDRAGVPWEMSIDSDSSRTVEATVVADLAVTAQLAGAVPQLFQVSHGGALPDLGTRKINFYVASQGRSEVLEDLVGLVRRSFMAPQLAATG
ncbi:LysR family transcriptional regulator [Silicimonas algicola]|uniref:LysR family transcriptional regulator n=1 Tax=Silicimonas algicola TaxID=1826607 RepID=A0A316G8F6_9RHOB|nr:LysR family transcriptional regulator [Silicimonas algicola]AZQ67557.1 LysR family transcriptional regulator [Silicimonas algicola]PWK57259.1 LysR family transcriptional regulator [Silicimonas algicola]